MDSLSASVSSHLQDAFRPKTKRAYYMMFGVFIVFCIIMKVSEINVSIKVMLAFLEC